MPSATDFFNLSFRYDVKSRLSPLLDDLQLIATINNIFDTKEQISRTTTGGIIGGSTNPAGFHHSSAHQALSQGL
jgi:hypothetical protein